jgi:hypothetical protein
MTMEDARKAGLVRKIREVPEDYGVNDTTGLPPSNIPRMRVSMDPSMNKPVTPLNRELLKMPANDENRQARSQLVAGLAQGSKLPPPDATTNPFANSAIVNNSPLVAGVPAPQPLLEDQEVGEEALEESMAEQAPEVAPAMALPEPDIAELREMEAAEPQHVAPPPAPKLTQPPKPPLKAMTPKNQFTCMACSAQHKFRSQLLNHAKLKHADRVTAIMAPYPEAPA